MKKSLYGTSKNVKKIENLIMRSCDMWNDDDEIEFFFSSFRVVWKTISICPNEVDNVNRISEKNKYIKNYVEQVLWFFGIRRHSYAI